MRIHPALVLLSITAVAPHAWAQTPREPSRTAEIALSNDTLELRYIDDARGIVDVPGAQAAGTFFLSEDRDIVLDGSLLFPADLDLGPLSVLFGPRVYAALLEEENNDVFAASLGGEIRMDLNSRSGLAVVGHAFYAPDILTFGSADSLTDLSARVELRVAARLTAFGGMRWFEFDLADGSGKRTLQEEVFVGFGYQL